MAAGNVKSFFFVLVLLLTSLFTASGARPLNHIAGSRSSISKGMEVFFHGFSLEGIKTGGPSSDGEGHAYTNAVNNSGPSSEGQGHTYTVTNSGPSAGGKGHAFTDAVTNSGPSSGVGGHAYTDAVVNSGPRAGGKGHAFSNAVTNSGPSPAPADIKLAAPM